MTSTTHFSETVKSAILGFTAAKKKLDSTFDELKERQQVLEEELSENKAAQKQILELIDVMSAPTSDSESMEDREATSPQEEPTISSGTPSSGSDDASNASPVDVFESLEEVVEKAEEKKPVRKATTRRTKKQEDVSEAAEEEALIEKASDSADNVDDEDPVDFDLWGDLIDGEDADPSLIGLNTTDDVNDIQF